MNLFEEFTPQTKADWLAKIEKDLKGKSIETLDWKISNDLVISAIAHQDDFENLPVRLVSRQGVTRGHPRQPVGLWSECACLGEPAQN